MSSSHRLGKRFADEVVENLISPLLEGQRSLFSAIQLINKAHVVMLVEENIIKADDAEIIFKALFEIDEIGPMMPLDPYLHEIYNNIENKVINLVGIEIGGRMMTGRSRNDLYACAFRLVVREMILKIINEVTGTIEILYAQSENYHDTIMPGFTHAQPAQPTLLGHYLLGFADALEEDLFRLKDVYRRTNLNPLGAAAFAGTSFEINRDRTTVLMCFDGVVENALKAVGDYGYLLETISILAIMTNNVSRFMADFIPWTSAVYGMLEIDDSFACTSSIMPQKKNPFTAETLRSTSGAITGSLMQGLNVTKGIPMGFNFDLLCFSGWSLDHIEQVRKSVTVLTGLLKTMIVDKKAMERHALAGFSTATEVAEKLVRKRGLSFRAAHGVVAAAVRIAIQKGKSAISAEDVIDAGKDVLNTDLQFNNTELGADASQIVNNRASIGCSSPKEVQRMVRIRQERLAAEKAWIGKETKRIGECQKSLDHLIQNNFGL